MRLIAASYSGVLGGAERILLDFAAGLPEPPELALPEGPVAEEARARGLGVFELRERSLVLRAGTRDRVAAPLRLAGHAAELRALIANAQPEAVIAWGMRTGMAMSAALAGGPPLPMMLHHHDLLPGPLVARAVRAAAGRASLVVALSECVARDLDPEGTLGARLRIVRPGVDLERFGARDGAPEGAHVRDGARARLHRAGARRDRALEAPGPGPRGHGSRRARAARAARTAGGRAARPRRARAFGAPSRARGAAGPARPGGAGGARLRPRPRAGCCGLPAALRGRRAVRPGGGRGDGQRPAGGGAGRMRARRDRRAGLRTLVPAGQRLRGRRRAGGGPLGSRRVGADGVGGARRGRAAPGRARDAGALRRSRRRAAPGPRAYAPPPGGRRRRLGARDRDRVAQLRARARDAARLARAPPARRPGCGGRLGLLRRRRRARAGLGRRCGAGARAG